MLSLKVSRFASRVLLEGRNNFFSSVLVSKCFVHTQEIKPGDISFIEPIVEQEFDNTGSIYGDAFSATHDSPNRFCDTLHIDTFSRARVVNFIKRFSKGSIVNSNEIFQTHNFSEEGEKSLFHCRVQLPFDSERGELWAHGVACNTKDAELLAAMHAEYIIDEFGYHIYTLPSMQRKHAEAARKAGRWAPMPDDVDLVRSNRRVPLPLRRILNRDETESGKWLLIDVRPSYYITPSHTLLSPCIFDPAAVHRIKSLFAEHNLSFVRLCTSHAKEPLEKGDPAFFEADILLPAELTTFTDLIAQGKALSRESAVTLACMHAELVIDAHGINLFPADAVMQKKHALAAWSYGRPAPLPGEPHKNPSHVVCPLPIKELSVRRGFRVSGMSYEEDLVRRHRLLTDQTCEFIETTTLDNNAVELLKGFLREAKVPREDSFFVEQVQDFYKATVVLPVPDLYGLRGGVGIGPTAVDSKTLAAMHAIDVLHAIGVPILKDTLEMDKLSTSRRISGASNPAESPDPSQSSPPGRRRSNANVIDASTITTNSTTVKEVALDTKESIPARSTRRRVAKRVRLVEDPQDTTDVSSTRNIGETTTASFTFSLASENGRDSAGMPAENGTQRSDSIGGGSDNVFDTEFLLKARESVPRELWDLQPDSTDGFIMVSPTDPETRTQYEYALYSPRQIDTGAKNRLRAFLASMGRRPEDAIFVQRLEAEENGGQAICRCAVNLPVPRRFGDRIALGEAVDLRDAEILAAMHAELILDTLGIPLYADDTLQRRHVELSARIGRYAPMPITSSTDMEKIPGTTPSPPPLRREVVGSIQWEKKERSRRKSVVVSRTTIKGEVGSGDSILSEIEKENAAETPEIPKERLDYSFVKEKELDPVSRQRVQYYLRRKGIMKQEAEFRMEVRSLGNVFHIAEVTLPVPASYGPRVAHGAALTKRDAEILCWMHAERILDTLGLPLFDNLPKLQGKHVERVRALGRWAPPASIETEILVAKPIDTPSPLPLTLGATPEELAFPIAPKNIHKEWESYVEECQKFIEVITTREQNTFYEMEKTPRTSDAIYDACLEESEKLTLENDAKSTLQRYCNAANVIYPSYWRSRTVGPVACRVCHTTIEVPGHEHIQASGVAVNKDNSQRRAAMHALALLRRIEPDFPEIEKKLKSEPISLVDPASVFDDVGSETKIRATQRTSKRHIGNWDHAEKDFSHEGKVRIVELFTVCFGLPPPLVRHLTRRNGDVVTHTTTVEVTDEDGKTWIGRGSDAGVRFNEPVAYEDLFSKLSRGMEDFKVLMDLIQTHRHLDPEHIANVSLSDAQKERMQRAIEGLPDVEDEEAVVRPQRWDESQGEQVGLLARVAMDEAQRAQESYHLTQKYQEKLTSEEYNTKYAPQRQRLSIYAKREEIVKAIEQNPIVIICGTTGCGKTTQVPQFILDNMIEKGEGGNCSIVITQPRRLSAVSIAQRVAAERLETVGETCGYSIRLDNRSGRIINFCTSGILLRVFHNTPLLHGINYLIIDEIHERDINSDFLLILLRQLLCKRKDLHVILMSATLQAEQFGTYFNGAPIINVEGYVHPVQELYLEDLIPIAAEQKVMPPLLKEAAAAFEKDDEVLSCESGNDPKWNPAPASTARYGFLEATSDIDYVTVQFAIGHAIRSLDLTESSVLVFLPGWDEITRAKEILERDSKFYIICLHSSVGAEEQMRCFLPAPEGKVKLILSTNIAESGVTIDDVAAVVDIGRAKEKSYVLRKGTTLIGRNEMGSMSQLVTVYASRANCVQRRGRAGRTRPGMCIRLYSRRHFNSLHDFQTPEMLRTPLDALCLQILALGLGDPAEFLQRAIEPPSQDHIEAAMRRLNELGATTSERLLTPLGLRLAHLPVDPKVGKMVIMGAILRCLDSALTIAAVTDTDVFITAREHKDAVRLHKEDLSMNTQSDVIASVNGFNFWVVAHHEKTPAEVVYELQERMLSVPQLLTVSKYKRQFFEIVENSGFIEASSQRSREEELRSRADIFVDRSAYSVDALHVGLVKCVVASGLFPNVVMNRGKRLMRNKLENRMLPSSASVVHRTSQENITHPFFVYDELTKSTDFDRLMVRGLTNVSIWMILLMGTSSMPVTYRDELSLGVVDGWIMFRATFGTLELIRKFKRALNVCLSRKFLNPKDMENNARLEELREIIKELVSTPFKPNELSDRLWEEKGVIIEPRTRTKEQPVKELQEAEVSSNAQSSGNADEKQKGES